MGKAGDGRGGGRRSLGSGGTDFESVGFANVRPRAGAPRLRERVDQANEKRDVEQSQRGPVANARW